MAVPENDNILVEDLVERFREAFNSHNPKIFGLLLLENAEWTDVMGQTMIGRKEIEDGHTYPFTTELNSSYVEAA